MNMFSIGQTVEYKTHDGRWYSGTIVEVPDSPTGDFIIDATVVEYRPNYVTRSASYIREAR